MPAWVEPGCKWPGGQITRGCQNTIVPFSQSFDFSLECIMTPLQSLIASGTKLWLDSIDPELVKHNRALGATGATSNPIIISDLIKTGRFDDSLKALMRQGLDDEAVAWQMTDQLVRQAQKVFEPVWEATRGDDGYVSFELDPLLEDPSNTMSVEERARHYVRLGKQWSQGHTNR